MLIQVGLQPVGHLRRHPRPLTNSLVFPPEVQERVPLDARAALDVLADRPEVDSRRLAILGTYLGARYAVEAAVGDGRIGALVMLFGYIPTREQRDADRIRAALLDPDSASAFPLWVSAIPLLEHPDGARVRLQVSAAFKEFLMIPTGVEGPPTSQGLVQVGGAVVPLRQRPGADGVFLGGAIAPGPDLWATSLARLRPALRSSISKRRVSPAVMRSLVS